MDRQTLLAFIVWAIDTDRVDYPFTENWKKFQENAVSMLLTYTDPEDVTMYLPRLVGSNPITFFTDYILFYAKMHLEANRTSSTLQPNGTLYGKYENEILNYKRL